MSVSVQPRRVSTTGLVALLAVAAVTLGTPSAVRACPFCNAPSLTLAEMVDQSDAVLLVEWAGGKRPEGEMPGETTYRVVRALKNGTRTFQAGDPVTLVRYRPGEEGELSLLTGTEVRTLEWSPPMPVDETIVRYIEKAPSPKTPTTERLAYYLDFLEFPEETIASDAYGEFANAPYDDIKKLRDKLPRERLRRWIQSDEIPPTRMGLYGLLLGLCGNRDDAAAMEEIILKPTTEFRLGIEGVMSGYVLITGTRGLEVIERTKFTAKFVRDQSGNPVLDDDGEPEPVPFSETYAGMQALRFLQQYEKGVVPSERLNASMRLLLDRPELSDLVIADLARWKDWSVTNRLVELYGTEGYEVGAVKRAIIRYLTAATRDLPAEKGAEPGPHVARAARGLAALRKRDPETVAETEKFLELLLGPPPAQQ